MQNNRIKSNHGGKRPNSGRKKLENKKQFKSKGIEASLALEIDEAKGSEYFSDFIKKIFDFWKKNRGD